MDERQLQFLIAQQLGSGQHWQLYDRTDRTPMNLVLDDAERRVGRELNLVWVDRGFPELFMLDGGTFILPVFNFRYIEVSAAMRKAVTAGYFDADLRREQAWFLALRIMGEMALRRGYADLAVRCLALSLLERQIWIPDAGTLHDQEMPPYNEAYAALWYYGVLHEIGHAVTVSGRTLVADEFLALAVEDALPTHLPPGSPPVAELWEAILRDPVHVLNPAQLRPEIVADMFAASILLETTAMIMDWLADEAVDPLTFTAECLTSTAVIEIVERCRRRVDGLGDTTRPEKPAYEAERVALSIRRLYVRRQIADDLNRLFGGEDLPMPVLEGAIVEIYDHQLPALRDGESGLQPAMAVAGESSPVTADVLGVLGDQVGGPDPSFAQRHELATLHELARTSSPRTPLLDAFTDLAARAAAWPSGTAN